MNARIARTFFLGLVAGAPAYGLIAGAPAYGQIQNSGYILPMALAIEAASEAVTTCSANGYKVSASVVDVSGELRVFLKGDHSTAHTRESSFRKAYTVASMGPIAGFDTLSDWVEKLKANPAAAALTSIPNILPLPGGVALKAKGEIVAGLGVGGAPGGDKDEACAAAGLAKIKDRLPR
jgi:uncharacterized protein GlcG (DUF336 family)